MSLISTFFPPLKEGTLKRMMQMLKYDSRIMMAKIIQAIKQEYAEKQKNSVCRYSIHIY